MHNLNSNFRGVIAKFTNIKPEESEVSNTYLDRSKVTYTDISKIFDYSSYPHKINFECGSNIKAGYLNIDSKEYCQPNLVADIRKLDILPSDFYEEIIADNCLEKFPISDTESILRESYRLLKQGGSIKIKTTNLMGLLQLFLQPDRQSFAAQKQLVQGLFGTQVEETDWHFNCFTQIIIEHYLQQAGFKNIVVDSKDEYVLNINAQKQSEQYVYRPAIATQMSFTESLESLQNKGCKIIASGIDNVSPHIVSKILDVARTNKVDFKEYEIDIQGYQQYFQDVGYLTTYADYYRGNQAEKSLEHYLSFVLLNLNKQDVFIDIASENSPIPEIYSRLTGATTFSQDIMYSDGINGNQIGGDACCMPIPDKFASKAALTCSIEHFENDADTRLFHELSRVLKPGGIVCVIPFYIFETAATQTDPTVSVPAGVIFDEGTTIYGAEGWGNRHGRFYSPESFVTRIMNPVKDKFKFDFYYLKNAADIDVSVYARFAFTATRL